MLFTETIGRKVVSTGNASTVGHVGSLVIDPSVRRVVGLSLKKTHGAGTMLPWTGITAFGADAVTVSGEDQIVDEEGALEELNSKAHHIIKKRVLTTSGQQIGIVRDVDFDPSDGTILGIITDGPPIDGRALLGVGSYAVVVRG
ncbi:PRC-barrel domain-containing protein [Nakamurella panacisegetis]|uniref:PRC-barrel domain-containing protein n=1 Tax=Nakamurella panacisegetis TaxID=1090615 RepID=A0A1H0L5D5_9ACTN|nr:PRC-barrel domain-containing protein [Nakamurella panacisegetis]SDO63295.1 PRC-barrel domain-containing protein [Nakamurella panacisegetis]